MFRLFSQFRTFDLFRSGALATSEGGGTEPVANNLLLESGDALLLESGDYILLESA